MQRLKTQVRKMQFRNVTWIFNSGGQPLEQAIKREVVNFSALQISKSGLEAFIKDDV